MSNIYSADLIPKNSGGGLTPLTVETITADKTLTDWNVVENCNAQNNAINVTLPTVENNSGLTITITKIDNSNNYIRIFPKGTQTINGSTNPIYLFSKDDSVVIINDGTNCTIQSDNRQGFGSGASYLKARTSTSIVVANGAPFVFNTVESQFGNKISINTTNGQITLKGGSTYKLTASGSYCSAGYWDTSWYVNGTEIVGTRSQAEGASVGADLTNIIVVSPTVDTVYTYCNVSTGSGTFGSDGAKLYPWVYVEEISRQATIVNITDYFIGRMNTLTAFSSDTNNPYSDVPIVKLNGNLEATSPYITLKAGKTYLLEASLAIRCLWAQYGWFDLSGIALPNLNYGATGSLSSTDPTSITPSVVVITPISDMKVKLQVKGSTLNTGNMSNDILNSSIKITQIGSSAVTNIPDSMLTNVVTVGDVKMTARQTAPTGWLICDGSALSRTTYANLFSAIGTTYGVGDGTNTFNIPDLRGRVPVGINSSDSDFSTVGKTGGEKSHKLTQTEMPRHQHTIYGSNNVDDRNFDGTGGRVSAADTQNSWNPSTEFAGGDGYHNNLQPYVTLNYIIKY